MLSDADHPSTRWVETRSKKRHRRPTATTVASRRPRPSRNAFERAGNSRVRAMGSSRWTP